MVRIWQIPYADRTCSLEHSSMRFKLPNPSMMPEEYGHSVNMLHHVSTQSTQLVFAHHRCTQLYNNICRMLSSVI